MKKRKSTNSKSVSLQSQINQLENENADLIKKIASASVEDAARYRQQYNQNKSRITQLQTELASWQKKMEEPGRSPCGSQ